jgi:FAD dependent oxidoreductase TIGR03364
LICSGADFETLFASEYAKLPITKCKLQMMRLHQPIEPIKIGPALCGALSLAHYKSFEAAPSLIQLKHRFQTQFPEYMKWGIHVMVSQNEELVLTVGDTHEYGLTFDPFDRSFLNEMVTDYLKSFASFPHAQVIETWNGIYPKMKNGATEIHFEVEPGIHVINGLGGAGMTLSFGLAEEVVASL